MSVQRNDWSLQRKGIIDQERHKERIRDAVRKNLGSIVSNESIILSNGRKTVKVPMRSLDEYKFRFDYRKRKQVGQGDGKTKVGDVIGRESQPGQGQGSGQAGDLPGRDYYEADVDIDEIAALIFEDLHLPFLEDKAKQAVQAKTTRFSEIRKVGALSNLDKRRSILENMRRQARQEGHAKLGRFKKEYCDSRAGKRTRDTNRTLSSWRSWMSADRWVNSRSILREAFISGWFAFCEPNTIRFA